MHSALHFDTRPVGLDIARKGAPLFNQKRCAGTPLADLMAATGLQKDGIYRHFSSKQELATAATIPGEKPLAEGWTASPTLRTP
jgi:hypothetical protein